MTTLDLLADPVSFALHVPSLELLESCSLFKRRQKRKIETQHIGFSRMKVQWNSVCAENVDKRKPVICLRHKKVNRDRHADHETGQPAVAARLILKQQRQHEQHMRLGK